MYIDRYCNVSSPLHAVQAVYKADTSLASLSHAPSIRLACFYRSATIHFPTVAGQHKRYTLSVVYIVSTILCWGYSAHQA